jgi:hypothetical protein
MTRARDLASGLAGVRPFAMSAGNITANGSGVTVTFPSGRFTQVPKVSTGAFANGLDASGAPLIASLTTTGFTLVSYRDDGGTSRTANVDWIAVQMTSGAASG